VKFPKKKILFCFGTRPEVIKISPLIKKSLNYFDVCSVVTGQHNTLFRDVEDLLPKVDYHIEIPVKRTLNFLFSKLFIELEQIFLKEKPDLVIALADTASAYCAAICAFNMQIPVAHVEAGLRTYNVNSPFPEEFYRQAISRMSVLNWCPNENNAQNLIKEQTPGKIIITGNTTIDLIYQHLPQLEVEDTNQVLITLHRRENKDYFEKILKQIRHFAEAHPELKFIFPAHPNPSIQKVLNVVKYSNIEIVSPLKYLDFLKLMAKSKFIITDSGGIQEEVVCLKKKTLVCRDTTERQEAIDVGVCKLVGSNLTDSFEWALSPVNHEVENPFGDGHACDRIIESMERYFDGR